MKIIIITILILGLYYVHLEESLLCSEEFCKNVTAKVKCRDIPEVCSIQNETYNGIFLPSPSPCSCCEYCMENLGEGEVCTVGDEISLAPSSLCGPGLGCKKHDGIDDPTCQTIETKCTAAQKKYDKDRASGNLGHLEVRPECDASGLYKPYICVPGELCYCVSAKGERIFGEIPVTNLTKDGINCTCSRSFHQALELVNPNLHKTEHSRCQSNGDFDTIQCLNSQCFCVDPNSGRPFNSSEDNIDITEFSPRSILCFNNETHEEFAYYRECELTYREQLKLAKENARNKIEVLGMSLPNCQLDGYFAPVQENKTAKYCVDPKGNILESFVVLKTDTFSFENMNCKCARARSIIRDVEKPECNENGNYKSVQCRRGFCRCVNENGLQYGKEVELGKHDSLACLV